MEFAQAVQFATPYVYVAVVTVVPPSLVWVGCDGHTCLCLLVVSRTIFDKLSHGI